jgi:hypothetical protein
MSDVARSSRIFLSLSLTLVVLVGVAADACFVGGARHTRPRASESNGDGIFGPDRWDGPRIVCFRSATYRSVTDNRNRLRAARELAGFTLLSPADGSFI